MFTLTCRDTGYLCVKFQDCTPYTSKFRFSSSRSQPAMKSPSLLYTKTVILALLLWIHRVDFRKDTICSSIINTIQVDLKQETHTMIDWIFCCSGFCSGPINRVLMNLSWPHHWGQLSIHPHKKRDPGKHHWKLHECLQIGYKS